MSDFLPDGSKIIDTLVNEAGEAATIYRTPDGGYIATIEDAPYYSGSDYETIKRQLSRAGF